MAERKVISGSIVPTSTTTPVPRPHRAPRVPETVERTRNMARAYLPEAINRLLAIVRAGTDNDAMRACDILARIGLPSRQEVVEVRAAQILMDAFAVLGELKVDPEIIETFKNRLGERVRKNLDIE